MPSPPIVGTHGMFILQDVNSDILEKIDIVKKRLWNVALECKLTVVAESGYQFEPVGVTYILVLAESHLSIHTYPENGTAYVDLFCCNPTFDMNLAVDSLQRSFDTKNIEWNSILR